MKARNEGDQYEKSKSDKAIRLAMDQCDELQVSFKLQNQTLMAAEQRVPFSSIEKNITNELKINNGARWKANVRTKPKDDELEILR
ncbi:hypothetical protein ACFSCZ_12510 [Siminovitchia sediminis]|uniref:Uncharacterized protein n=1 Tax=Siminovitchia sediminis TaxID=1274353 RepID=A0ABW4KL93_9BACI